jgi:hypothetical protein
MSDWLKVLYCSRRVDAILIPYWRGRRSEHAVRPNFSHSLDWASDRVRLYPWQSFGRSRMNVEALMELRKRVGDALSEQRATIEKQLAGLGSSIASVGEKIARSARGAH